MTNPSRCRPTASSPSTTGESSASASGRRENCSFVRSSLREKRSRTLVTIIGIILSMSLFMAVIEGAYSGIQFLIRAEEALNGRYRGFYYDLDEETFAAAQAAEGVSETAGWQTVGWAKIGSQNENKPYLLIKSVSENFTDLVAVDLISGRMPETESEILIPAHLATNGNVVLLLGDMIRLSVGRRVSDGYVLARTIPISCRTSMMFSRISSMALLSESCVCGTQRITVASITLGDSAQNSQRNDGQRIGEPCRRTPEIEL